MGPNAPSGDDRAVSPVIGVLRVVAITVVLATVVDAFATDLGDSVSGDVRAGANVESDEATDTVEVVSTSTDNAEAFNVTIDNGSTSETYERDEVGESVVVTGDGVEHQGAVRADDFDDFAPHGLDDGDEVQVIVVARLEERDNVILTDSYQL